MKKQPDSGRRPSGTVRVQTVRSGGSKRPAKPPRKRSGKKGFIWLFFILVIGVLCAVAGYLLVILNGERILSQNLNKFNLDQASVITDKDGKQVAKLYVAEGNREVAPIGQIPQLVKDAFVATEDRRFYEHNGVDVFSIGRALVKDIMSRSAKEGASTITQQVARNLFLNADKTLFRKATEASIALAMERRLSKDEILELYLNRIYFGRGQYGIKTAAKYYFNKDITSKDKSQQLEIWEIATLAAMPKAPETYNPVKNPEKSKERRAVVLAIMQEEGLITAEQAEKAKQVDYDPSVVPKTSQQYQSFIDYVVEEAQDVTGLGEEELLSGGFTIRTTIDTNAQKAMEDAFRNDENFEESKDEIPMQGAMIIMNQHDGSILAMVGGRDYERQGWNRVTKPRQPGSSFKPIASYGPALETGQYFPWSILRDDKTCYDNGKYCPTDSNKVKYIGPVTMSQAVKESRNQPAVWLLNEIGVKKGLEFAKNLGFNLDPEKDRNLAIALGGLTNGVSPLEMARAYAAFANGGTLQEPHTILSIANARGNVVYEYKEPKAKQVMSPETAYYVTQVLQEVTKPGGTGTRARISGRVVAGKTGTTQHGIPGLKSSANRDVWFVGYTPELTAAVWMGYDSTDKDHLVRKSSGQAAAMFANVMSKALEGKKKRSFPKPEGVIDKKPELAVTDLTAAYDPASVSVSLTWKVENAGEGTIFKVYRKSDLDADFLPLAETAEPQFDDYAIFPDLTYTYYVTAYDPKTKQESKPSEQASVTIVSGTESPFPPPLDGIPPGSDPGFPGEGGTPGGNGTGNGGTGDDGTGGGGTGDGGNGGTGDGNGGGESPGDGNVPGDGQAPSSPSPTDTSAGSPSLPLPLPLP